MNPSEGEAMLAPCPFCGAQVEGRRDGIYCETHGLIFLSEEQWNTRAAPQPVGNPLSAFDPTNHHNAEKCPYCNPDGRVLMPREATRTMTMAGCDSLPACEHVFGYAGEMLKNAYRKMVEAVSPQSNAEPANRSTVKATANVGDDGERMGSEPEKGIVTGGSDPTLSIPRPMLSTPEGK